MLLLCIPLLINMMFNYGSLEIEIVLQNLNQEPITRHIIKYVGDQSNPETKLANFKALLKCRRVNKQWCRYCEQEHKRLLDAETSEVEKFYEQDYREVNIKKRIYSYVEFREGARRIGCAIGRNLIMWLYDYFSHNPKNNIKKVYHINLPDDVYDIFPITWAVYIDAQQAQKLLCALYSANSEFVQQLQQAQCNKKLFDDIAPGQGINNIQLGGRWGRVTRSGMYPE